MRVLDMSSAGISDILQGLTADFAVTFFTHNVYLFKSSFIDGLQSEIFLVFWRIDLREILL